MAARTAARASSLPPSGEGPLYDPMRRLRFSVLLDAVKMSFSNWAFVGFLFFIRSMVRFTGCNVSPSQAKSTIKNKKCSYESCIFDEF